MKFGVRLPHFRHIASDLPKVGDNVRTVARAAEELGFDCVSVGDHIVTPSDPASRYGSVWIEALSSLTFAAGCTDRVRLVTSVLVAPYRHPVLAAKTLASLDVLSNGRLDVGLAVGWFEREFQTLGLDTFRARGRATDEYIQVMKMLWSGEGEQFAGQIINLDMAGLDFEPRPIQRPGPPIWIGGNSDRAAQRVVELGDGWTLMTVTPEQLGERATELRRQCDAVGRDRSTVSIALQQSLRFTDKVHGQAAPLVGPVQHVREQVQSFGSNGADLIILDLFFGDGVTALDDVQMPDIRNAMETFASDVMPHV